MVLFPYTPGLFNKGYVPASKALAIVNVVAFIIMETLPPHFSDLFALKPQGWLTWQIISYQFMHAGIMHLVGNMFFLLAFGPVVEEKLGSTKMILVYLIGGMFAGWAWMAVDQSGFLPLVGASGSISALTGASFVLRPHVPMAGFIWILFFIIRISFPVWAWALYFFILDYLNFMEWLFGSSGSMGNVAHSAHIGGFLSAFLGMIVLRYLKLIRPTSSDLISHFSKSIPSSINQTPSFVEKKTGKDKDKESELKWHQTSSIPLVIEKIEAGEQVPAEKILSLSFISREQGESIDAYKMLQTWLEKNSSHNLAPKVAYELGILCLRHLGRHDLAREWFEDVLARHPDDQLKQRAESALSVL